MSALSDLAHGYLPERLVPGDPGAVAGLGDALAGYADLLADAARALGRVEVSWDGAAAGGFRDEFGLQPGRFSAAARSFDAGCAALGRYAATLLSAQLAAGRARDLFAEGMRAATAAGGGPLGVDAGPLEVMTSPAGLQQRLAAVELLERVRADVDRAGNEAAETLRSAMASAPEPTPAWQHASNFLLAPPWELNQERRDWAAGAAVGILDTVVLATNPLPVALWVGATSKRQVNAFERRFGVDPRSGFHGAGAVVVPAVLTGAVGVEGVASRTVMREGMEALAGKPANPIPDFLFRSGSASESNMTPRPVDTTGPLDLRQREPSVLQTGRSNPDDRNRQVQDPDRIPGGATRTLVDLASRSGRHRRMGEHERFCRGPPADPRTDRQRAQDGQEA